MPLIADVKKICDRLSKFGWRDLLRRVTGDELDIAAGDLGTELAKELKHIDREICGFDDFTPFGKRGIEPGRPSHSLLFHALASPAVHPTAEGVPSSDPSCYPTLSDLDTVENYIYSLIADRKDLEGTIIAVFSYQYRPANRTAHLKYADLTFSRTGVARVGTAPNNYDASRRGFWVLPTDGADEICVLPARYAAFLARISEPSGAGSVQGGHAGNNGPRFVFPVHKLFEGKECLADLNIKLRFQEFHINEKLKKMHELHEDQGGLRLPAGFDVDGAPFCRDSVEERDLVTLVREGSSTLLVPKHSGSLIRTAGQYNSELKKDQLAYFEVPPQRRIRGRSTRYVVSTLEIPAVDEDRIAPEYANIRHKIDPSAPPAQPMEDLNTLPAEDFENTINQGGYRAAHFVDDSCDGCVEAVVSGLEGKRSIPAYSLVSAPDFFPLADQIEVAQRTSISNSAPLSEAWRDPSLPANITIPLPGDGRGPAFQRDDITITSVVGSHAGGETMNVPDRENRLVSFLPDSASNVFAPGWDTSRSTDGFGSYFTTSGLGSPFPEDAKLCAALSSFWPAVAPDNGRTFGNIQARFRSRIPMLDSELGRHPDHPDVKSGKEISRTGWDGEYGPFFEKVRGRSFVNHAAIERSDYVRNALRGSITCMLTANVQSAELIARFDALQACLSIAPGVDRFCLVTFEPVKDWAKEKQSVNELCGPGYAAEFGELADNPQPTGDLTRSRRAVERKHIFRVAANGVGYRRGGAAFRFFPF